MISNKGRELRKTRMPKMSKKMERLYKDVKCRDCTVVVTRMNFAKILGKFTKVKIQYESDVPSKTKPISTVKSPNTNSRLKNNENGMVLIHKNAYVERPKKDISIKKDNISLKKPKTVGKIQEETKVLGNVLKENRLKRTLELNDTLHIYKKTRNLHLKKYEIGFKYPKVEMRDLDLLCNVSLREILHNIDKRILPSNDWCIEYLPKSDEPQHDKVYDRIAAELEGIMNNEKPSPKKEKVQITNNNDSFPSIMDILNENTESTVKTKDNLESSDVEAMLLGKSNAVNKKEIVHVNIDNDMKKLLEDVEKLDPILEAKNPDDKLQETSELHLDRPLHSPSILDEALQKGIEEHLPVDTSQTNITFNENDVIELKKEDTSADIVNGCLTEDTNESIEQEAKSKSPEKIDNNIPVNDVSHVVFSKIRNGKCYKSVTCPQDMKYKVELEGKIVQLLGAPKYIESVDDLQILLQIIDECDLKSMYLLD